MSTWLVYTIISSNIFLNNFAFIVGIPGYPKIPLARVIQRSFWLAHRRNENGDIESTVSSDKLNRPEIKALYYNLYYDNAGINNQRVYQKYPAYQTYNDFKRFAIDKFGLEVDQVEALRLRGLHPAYPDHHEPIFVQLDQFRNVGKNQ